MWRPPKDDFEACIAHLRLPVKHRRLTRTTNLLERLFVEERNRLQSGELFHGSVAARKVISRGRREL
jgi:transposase-like protein